MHEALFVLEDADIAFQHGHVERLRREAQQRMVGLALKQHGDLDAAPCRRLQRPPEAQAGQEIGVGDEDLMLRGVDCRDVGVEDVVAMPDVVADQEGCRLRAGRCAAGGDGRGEAQAALEIDPGDDFPEAAYRVVHLRENRPFDAHRVVVARPHVVRRIVVVDDIDAADEGDAGVDHGQLAMQAAQAMATEMEGADFLAVEHGADAGGSQARHEVDAEIASAEAVDRHADLDAACSSAAQRVGDGMADFVGGEDVAFEVDLVARRFDLGEQGGEVFAARVEQPQTVARDELSRHAWSARPTGRRGRKCSTTGGRDAPQCARP